MKITRTVVVEGDGIALDRLLFDVTGREDLVPGVLDANPGLAALGPVLPVGTVIRIPEASAAEEIAVIETTRLWDE